MFNSRSISILFLLCLSLFHPYSYASEGNTDVVVKVHKVHLDPRKVRLVDANSNLDNVLFRGNMPVVHSHFAYDELIAAMSHELEQKQSTALPDNLLIMDVSLISQITESHLLSIERHFARNHPDRLLLLHHPVYGALSSPDHHHHTLLHLLIHIPFIEGVYQLVESIHEQMHRDFGRPVAIFVHCKAGSDRTGMVIGAYQMLYLGMSYWDVAREAEEVARRPVKYLQHNGLKWIAYYYRDVLGIHSVGEI